MFTITLFCRANQVIEKMREEFAKEVSSMKLQLKKAELEAKTAKAAVDAKVKKTFSHLVMQAESRSNPNLHNQNNNNPPGKGEQGANGDL